MLIEDGLYFTEVQVLSFNSGYLVLRFGRSPDCEGGCISNWTDTKMNLPPGTVREASGSSSMFRQHTAFQVLYTDE